MGSGRGANARSTARRRTASRSAPSLPVPQGYWDTSTGLRRRVGDADVDNGDGAPRLLPSLRSRGAASRPTDGRFAWEAIVRAVASGRRTMDTGQGPK